MNAGPTVLLETGIGGATSVTWAGAARRRRFAPVVAYDRAGWARANPDRCARRPALVEESTPPAARGAARSLRVRRPLVRRLLARLFTDRYPTRSRASCCSSPRIRPVRPERGRPPSFLRVLRAWFPPRHGSHDWLMRAFVTVVRTDADCCRRASARSKGVSRLGGALGGRRARARGLGPAHEPQAPGRATSGRGPAVLTAGASATRFGGWRGSRTTSRRSRRTVCTASFPARPMGRDRGFDARAEQWLRQSTTWFKPCANAGIARVEARPLNAAARDASLPGRRLARCGIPWPGGICLRIAARSGVTFVATPALPRAASSPPSEAPWLGSRHSAAARSHSSPSRPAHSPAVRRHHEPTPEPVGSAAGTLEPEGRRSRSARRAAVGEPAGDRWRRGDGIELDALGLPTICAYTTITGVALPSSRRRARDLAPDGPLSRLRADRPVPSRPIGVSLATTRNPAGNGRRSSRRTAIATCSARPVLARENLGQITRRSPSPAASTGVRLSPRPRATHGELSEFELSTSTRRRT